MTEVKAVCGQRGVVLLVCAAAALAALASLETLSDQRLEISVVCEGRCEDGDLIALGTVKLVDGDHEYDGYKSLCEYANETFRQSPSYVTLGSVEDQLEEIMYSKDMFIRAAGPSDGEFHA